jgi:hypothetical protein
VEKADLVDEPADSSPEASLAFSVPTFDVRKAFPSFQLQFSGTFHRHHALVQCSSRRLFLSHREPSSWLQAGPANDGKLSCQSSFWAARLGNEFHLEISKIRGGFLPKRDRRGQATCVPTYTFVRTSVPLLILVEFDRFMNLLYCIFLNLSQCLSTNSSGGRTANPATQAGTASFRRNGALHSQQNNIDGLEVWLELSSPSRSWFEIAIETHCAGSGENHGEVVAPWK